MTADYLTFDTREAWRAWLRQHHTTATEAWLVHSKKRAAQRWIGYEEAVEEALCFGWIDGRLQSIDEETYALRYSPRRRGSIWAESNKRRVQRLIDEGRMTPRVWPRSRRPDRAASGTPAPFAKTPTRSRPISSRL